MNTNGKEIKMKQIDLSKAKAGDCLFSMIDGFVKVAGVNRDIKVVLVKPNDCVDEEFSFDGVAIYPMSRENPVLFNSLEEAKAYFNDLFEKYEEENDE